MAAIRGEAAAREFVAIFSLSAEAADGALIRQCRQCNRNLTLIRMDKPNGRFSESLWQHSTPRRHSPFSIADAQRPQ
jgi:hypothetical protein